MVGFPGMLTAPAEEAGMKVPSDPENFNPNEFPHFHVFCILQLGTSMPNPTAHWDNAKVIAKIPQEQIFSVTPAQVIEMGFQAGSSY